MTIEVIFQEALTSHSFSPTQQIQNSCSALSFPGVRGGGSRLSHSCGLVASKEDAGLRAALLKACGRRSKLRHYKDLPRQTSSTTTKSRFSAQKPRGEEAVLAALGMTGGGLFQ